VHSLFSYPFLCVYNFLHSCHELLNEELKTLTSKEEKPTCSVSLEDDGQHLQQFHASIHTLLLFFEKLLMCVRGGCIGVYVPT